MIMEISHIAGSKLDLLKHTEPPMKRRAGLRIVQAGRGSYRGMFWKLKHQHEMVLQWEDGFCDTMKVRVPLVGPTEDFCLENWNKILPSIFPSAILDGVAGEYPIGLALFEMSSASDVVGKGVIGKTALTGNACWIYSNNILANVFNSDLVPEYQDEWLLQFAAGIKTVLLLPVMPHGVLQLGSVEMVAEDAVQVAWVKNKFEAQITPSIYGCGYSAQQLSMMFDFPDELDEPLAITTGKEMDDQNTTPVVQEFGNSNPSFVTHVHEKLFEGDFSQQTLPPINWAEPCQLLSKDHGPFTTDNDIVMDFHCGEGANLPAFSDNIFESTFCDLDFELNRLLGTTTVEDNTNSYAYGPSLPGHDLYCHSVGDTMTSYCTDVSGVGPVGFSEFEGHLLETSVAYPSGSPDDNSANKSSITSSNASLMENLTSPRKYENSEKSAQVEKYDVSCDFLTPIASGINAPKISKSSDRQRKRKGIDFVETVKVSRLPITKKRKAHHGDGQRPKPRDRQLIQERLKELRDLVPNSEKCSIDGLLDKTVNHMLFLRSMIKRADKLRLHKQEVDEETRRAGDHENGTSWAVELGSEKPSWPIVVKDLSHPGQMLIQMICTDYERFLEISDVFHRLQITILEGSMEKGSDGSSWAHFIVETSGSFHRLDIFWPLMKLAQQNGPPVPT